MDLWEKLTDGSLLVSLDARAQSISECMPETIPPLMDDPLCTMVLPHLCYRLQPPGYPAWASGPRVSLMWKRSCETGVFLHQLHRRLADQFVSEGLPDGRVRQLLATDAARRVWHAERMRCCSATSADDRPDERDMPWHLAYAVAQLPGGGWSVTAEGLERVLPAHPLRVAPTSHPPNLELKSGLLAACVGWAYLPAGAPGSEERPVHELVYLSCVGPHAKLKAAWAALMDHKRDVIKVPEPDRRGFPDYLRTRRIEGKGVYRSWWNDTPLPESGLAHLSIEHASRLGPRTAQPFLHLVGADGTPFLPQFLWQLDRASTLPLKPTWAAQLWTAGLDRQVIVRLPSYGCTAYWVLPDEAVWADIVAACAGATGPATIATFGGDAPASHGVAVAVEEADEPAGHVHT